MNQISDTIDPDFLENDLIKHIHWSKISLIWLAFLGICFFICLGFYTRQLIYGLEVTGLHDYASWGIYISNFVFFVATSLVGMLISSILGLANIKWIIPIGRIAEIIALSFALVAGIVIVTDMGRPDRLLSVFVYGRIQSPIIWDVTVVITYSVMSLLLLYIPLIPDFALCERKISGLPAFQRKIYKFLSLGWADKPEQFAIIKKTMRIVLVAIIPVALAIHTVTSWLFALTMRPGWDSAIFGPYFVAGAFVAGSSAVIIAMFIFRKIYNLEKYITEVHFANMGKLLVLVSLLYLYFNINEMLVPAYKPGSHAGHHAIHLMTGSYAPLYWSVQIFGFILPFFLMLFPKMRKPAPIAILASIILIGAGFKRYVIVIPTMLQTYLPIQNVPEKYHYYFPTITEIAVTILPIFLVLIIITILSKTIPLIPVWEMKAESLSTKNHIY